MKNNKVYVLVVLVVLIAGALVWWFLSQGEKAPSTSSSSTSAPVHISTREDLTYPKGDGLWIVIDYDKNIPASQQLVDLTGWSVRSAVSGKSFTIGKVTLGDGTDGLAIMTAGKPAGISGGEGEIHETFGESSIAWGREHDTIQLVNSSGSVIDTYSY